LKLSTRRALWAYTFLAVPLAFFLLIRLFPTLQAFLLSLREWNVDPDQREFVGFSYYAQAFEDARFHRALLNTLFYTLIGVPSQLILGLGIALLLQSIRYARGLYRAIYFAPYVTPAVAVAWAWSLLLSPQLGYINELLIRVGLPPQPFLSSPDQALVTVTAVVVWQYVGFQIVLFLVGLESIPQEYYEAASIDGANGWHRFWSITLPLLNPVIVFSIIIATAAPSTGFLQLFTQVLNLNFGDPGGPLNSTLTVVLYIYQVAFQRFDLGYAAAISVLLFIMIFAITLLQLRVTRRKVDY
jgi:multiple sugar transport system permease protein